MAESTRTALNLEMTVYSHVRYYNCTFHSNMKTWQMSPDPPSPCEILKAIHAGVGRVWERDYSLSYIIGQCWAEEPRRQAMLIAVRTSPGCNVMCYTAWMRHGYLPLHWWYPLASLSWDSNMQCQWYTNGTN